MVFTSGSEQDCRALPTEIVAGNAGFVYDWCRKHAMIHDNRMLAERAFYCFFMGFILLRVLEFFVFRKMEMPETKNHLLCGWRQSVVQKNHLSVTIELFRHYCKKGKVILWRIRIMI